MPRKTTRPELVDKGALLNKHGAEIGRIALTGEYVINIPEMFFEILRWSPRHRNACTINHLNAMFSSSGSRTYDFAVAAAIKELFSANVVEYVDPVNPMELRPIASAKVAVDRLPIYVTRAEAHAGLEPINE